LSIAGHSSQLVTPSIINRQSTTNNPVTNQRSRISNALFRLFVRRVLATEAAVLAELEPLRRLLLILRRAVIPALTVAARHVNDVAHY
jgi:hypothetical protein